MCCNWLPSARWKEQPLAVTAWAYGFGVLCLVVSSLFYTKTISVFYIPFAVSPTVYVYMYLCKMQFLYYTSDVYINGSKDSWWYTCKQRQTGTAYICAACTCINYCFFTISAWVFSVMIGYSCNYTSQESNGWMSGLKVSRFTEEGPGLGRNVWILPLT